METNWSNARERRLEVLYRDGLSFSLIAADIGMSRNAVIGKAHRMKLPKRLELAVTKPNTRRVKSSQPKKRERRAIVMAKPDRPVIVPDRDYSCTIINLTDVTCRFPLWPISGHGDRLYCGVPDASISAGVPYCPNHAALCGTPNTKG